MSDDRYNQDGPAARALPTRAHVAPDITALRILMVNVYFVGDQRGWVLVDAGLPGCAGRIRATAARHLGPDARPQAILLTHGHFDHVGSVQALAEDWNVPIYAHALEMPYLTGRSSYPPPDPSVGGGMMARLSFLYPRGPIDLNGRVLPLPQDGSVPFLPGWRWLHTPGHTPGHVSFFREADGALLAGDAFVTTRQESARAVMAQRQRVHGPPRYYTQDWREAQASVAHLAELNPKLAATGHGFPMRGERLARELGALAANFERYAVPARGRYVRRPVLADERGTVALPPPVGLPLGAVLLGVGAALLAAAALRRAAPPDHQPHAHPSVPERAS